MTGLDKIVEQIRRDAEEIAERNIQEGKEEAQRIRQEGEKRPEKEAGVKRERHPGVGRTDGPFAVRRRPVMQETVVRRKTAVDSRGGTGGERIAVLSS